MIKLEYVRLALLGLLVLLAQLAAMLAFPAWRGGLDLYVLFLLLVTSARGGLFGGSYALAGGLAMDAISGPLPVFHLLYYLLPVALGAQLRSHMLLKFRSLGALALGGLLLGKVVLQYALLLAMGKLPGPGYILHLNYWPVLAVMAGVYIFWPQLVRLIPPSEERKRSVV